ncbi:MAG: DUF1810 domain-containing protein [Bacteroidota bacterium]
MDTTTGLERFIIAQEQKYEIALAEIKNSKKQSHWMWYIFPQLEGLGLSEMARKYGIRDAAEATAYLAHPLLGERLLTICNELMSQPGNDAYAIFGSPDDVKLRSCLTLFSALNKTDPVFENLLQKFYNGSKDVKTLKILHLN